MSESYESWRDRELLREYEADPESFREPLYFIMTDRQLIDRIRDLRKLAWVSKWHRERLAEYENEARQRKL
jgi:hypothetical protein